MIPFATVLGPVPTPIKKVSPVAYLRYRKAIAANPSVTVSFQGGDPLPSPDRPKAGGRLAQARILIARFRGDLRPDLGRPRSTASDRPREQVRGALVQSCWSIMSSFDSSWWRCTMRVPPVLPRCRSCARSPCDIRGLSVAGQSSEGCAEVALCPVS